MTPAELFGASCLLSLAFTLAAIWQNHDEGGLI